MNSDYKVGDLIYDANIYDGMIPTYLICNFISGGYPKTRVPEYSNFVVEQAGLLFQ